MNDKNKLAYFMTKLASLMDEYEVTIDNTSEDDGIHFFCGKEDVAIISPTSDDLIKKAMFMSSNIEIELNAIKTKYYSLKPLKSEHERSETKLITEKLMVDSEDLLNYLRMMGFGLCAWFYSNEDLDKPEIKKQIEASISHLLELNETDSKHLAQKLIQHTISFSENTVNRVKQTSKPHSLSEFIEGATVNKLLCYENRKQEL
ncbi:hypothetical protein [Aliivibrio fischeri]|uniref:hypothetical protein n=1 Tax=Aliivibrio fischeri TaxID=668 RepID=UPI0007C56FE3|nr:hypothetical protein [Aliivibrio fischeri]